jgi:hypothetical protein
VNNRRTGWISQREHKALSQRCGQDKPVHGARILRDSEKALIRTVHARLPSLQIPVSLAPSIFVDNISERNTADWPEPAHWVADRQQGIGVDAGRQSERGLGFLLEIQVEFRQCRAVMKIIPALQRRNDQDR